MVRPADAPKEFSRMAKETIADKVKVCWPGFKILESQTVGELRHWIDAEIEQLYEYTRRWQS
jgi:Trm5-related predicted tRNA methylase